MIRVLALSLLSAASAVPASAAEIQGYIADWNCVKKIVKDGAEKTFKDDRNCSLQDNPNRSAYGVITDNKKYYRLDEKGNGLAKELLSNSPSKDQVHVIVTGDVSGDTINVKDMSIL